MPTPQGRLLLLICKLLRYEQLPIVDLSLRYRTRTGAVIRITIQPVQT